MDDQKNEDQIEGLEHRNSEGSHQGKVLIIAGLLVIAFIVTWAIYHYA